MTGRFKSVQVTASTEAGVVTLHLVPGGYRISRKRFIETSWTILWSNRTLGDVYVDQTALAGETYEYQVESLDNGATGYVAAGMPLAAPAKRKALLVVSPLVAKTCDSELARLAQDLTNEGWLVERRDLSGGETSAQVKERIKTVYPDSVLLFGHIPVFRSGNYTYDGHPDHIGSYAADTYYGDPDGDWSASPSIIPAPLKFAVGRMDFSNLTCFSNKPNNPRSESDLMQQYLDKNHQFRTGQWNVSPRGAVCDNFPDRDFSSNAWRNFPSLFKDGIDEIPGHQFFPTLAAKDCLMSFGCGGGQFTSCDGVGGSDDFATKDIQTVFLGLLGSYFLDWDNESNFLRSALGSGKVLCSFGAGAPNVFLHRLAVGGTIGESMLLSMNNFVVYPTTGAAEKGLYIPTESTDIPSCAGRVHQALMGDPTLKLRYDKQDSIKIIDVLCSTDVGQSWKVIQSTEIDVTGVNNAIFKLAIH